MSNKTDQDLQRLLRELSQLNRLSDEVLSLVEQNSKDENLKGPMADQLTDLSKRTRRVQAIVEHWDGLLAQVSIFKPLVTGPARFIRWLSGKDRNRRQRSDHAGKAHARELEVSQPGRGRFKPSGAILFVAIAGVGLEHLCRDIAIARQIKHRAPSLDCVILSSCPALHLARAEGYPTYHQPSPFAVNAFDPQKWNQMLQLQLQEIWRIHQPSTLVFDGIWPYRPMMELMQETPAIKGVWLQKEYRKSPLEARHALQKRLFNLVIRLGEVGITRQGQGAPSAPQAWINPVVMGGQDTLLPREEARNALNLPQDSKVVLLALGTNIIDALFGNLDHLLASLSIDQTLQFVVAQSSVGRRLTTNHPQATILQDSTLRHYAKACDVAIASAGPHTAYELMGLGLPSLLLPSPLTHVDDQLARAQAAESAGAAICLEDPDENAIHAALQKLLDPEVAARMRHAGMTAVNGDGAEDAARLILGLGEPFGARPGKPLGQPMGEKETVDRSHLSWFADKDRDHSELPHLKRQNRCILFVATNGVGLGHLTGSLAVARRIKRISPETTLVMLTNSPAVHLIHLEGLIPHFLPPRELDGFGDKRHWNQQFSQCLMDLIERYRPDTLVFNGAFPYKGLREVLWAYPELTRVWMDLPFSLPPDTWREKHGKPPFNLVLRSGEIDGVNQGSRTCRGCEIIAVDPILYLDRSEVLGREKALRRLDLPTDCKLILVSLGVDNPRVTECLRAVQSFARTMPSTMVVIAESIIGERFANDDLNTRVIHEYPISLFFNAFDAAVTAAGLNTCHELLAMGLPALLIPSQRSTDVQLARAQAAQGIGAAICLKEPEENAIHAALQKLLDPEVAARMRRAGMAAVSNNGAEQAARLIMGLNDPKESPGSPG